MLFAINCVTALSFAFMLPVMSLFLITELNTPPAYLGIYTTLTSIITIMVSQKLTGLIDRGVSSKHLFCFALCGIIVSAIGFSYAESFWHALLIGCTVMPIASSAIPLILTMVRNYADASGQNSAKINSQMRSSVSLLWIFGPPLAFISVDKFGFTTNYYLSISFALLGASGAARVAAPAEAAPGPRPGGAGGAAEPGDRARSEASARRA